MGHGGIVVESGDVTINEKSNSNGGIKKFAGFDIAKDASVKLNVKVKEELHKIGQGTLTVTSKNDTNLRLGNGVVNVNANEAFKKFYITSGRATLKLGDSVNVFELNNVFFGNGGGKLDINGKSLEAKNISANDKNANIINSNSTQASLTIKGNDNADTIVYASIGGTQDNKINLTSSNNNHNLVFNSDVDINGNLKATNSKITLQGHPTTHATRTPNMEVETIKKYDKDMPSYMDLSRPSTLEQPDWDSMKFKTNGVELTKATLNVGKGASLESDVTADSSSSVNFGGDIEYFIDELDGKNTQSDLTYKQKIESKKLDAKDQGNDTIKYSKKIVAKGNSSINSAITNFTLL